MTIFNSDLWETETLVAGNVILGYDFISSGAGPSIAVTRGTDGSVIDSAGKLALAPINTQRVEYSPATLVKQGLVIDVQRTNSAPVSGGKRMMDIPVNSTLDWSQNNGFPKTSELQFSDDFERADTSDGTIGGGWDLRGPYVSGFPLPPSLYGRIQDGRFVADSDQVVYAVRNMGAVQTRMRATVSWASAGGSGFLGTAALIISKDDKLVSTMLHVVVTRNQAIIQKRVNGGAFVDMGTITFPTQLSLNTPYEIAVDVSDNTARLTVAGESVSVGPDNDIRTIVGNYVIFEIYHPDPDMIDHVRFESVSNGLSNAGFKITQTALNGYAQRNFTVANDSATHAAAVVIKKSASAAPSVRLNMLLVGGTTVSNSVDVNPQTGAITAGDGIVEDYGSYWRIKQSVTNNSSGNVTLCITVNPAVGQSSGTYDISDLQVELNKTSVGQIIQTAYGLTSNQEADTAVVDLPLPSDILVQDRSGGVWIAGVPAGQYTVTPRSGQRHISRLTSYTVGMAEEHPEYAAAYP